MPDHLPAVNRILDNLGFSESLDVEGRISIANLFPSDGRCGIYVLHAASDEYYVGQAVDVTRRYAQHLVNHDDIALLRFKEVTADCLNEVERDVIWELESAGIPLRNKSLTSIPVGESEFDAIMSEEAQQRWIADTGHCPACCKIAAERTYPELALAVQMALARSHGVRRPLSIRRVGPNQHRRSEPGGRDLGSERQDIPPGYSNVQPVLDEEGNLHLQSLSLS